MTRNTMSSMQLLSINNKPKVVPKKNHWFELHTYYPQEWDRDKAQDFFFSWQARIPNKGCNCRSEWINVAEKIPPDFRTSEDFFEWSIKAHNEINRLLQKPLIDYYTAYGLYREMIEQRSVKTLIVTSLSPLPKHLERQQICLTSWKAMGMEIVAVVPSNETIPRYAEIDELVTTDNLAKKFTTKPTVKITELLRIGARYKRPICLINSDIEAYGDNRLLQLKPGQAKVGIRYNYINDPYHSYREPYGLDVFIVPYKLVENIEDREYGIGKGMWDYWLPKWLMTQGIDLEFIGRPFFFHKNHELHWTQEDWHIAAKWFGEEFGIQFDTYEQSAAFRWSLPFPPPNAPVQGEPYGK